MNESYQLRVAQLSDVEELRVLISTSAHGLSHGDYSEEQVDGALQGVFGVDTQLITDGTYYVMTKEGAVVACGGWSYRATLFGSDNLNSRDPRKLNPTTEAAKIRAFFVHPDHARQGLGRWLLTHCEDCAQKSGFSKFELGSTLPGKRLYEVCGYISGEPVDHEMENGLILRVIPMYKSI